jgi:hypothetical protein
MTSSVDWDFNSLEEFIQRRGDDVIHETGVSCPCRASDPYGSTILQGNKPATQRRLDCSQCGGVGWLYRDAKILKGLVVGVEAGKNRQLLEMGYAVPGDCTFSPSLNADQLLDFDRITFLYSIPVNDGQVILRNAANLSDNAMLQTGLDVLEDRLWYEADCVFWCEDEDGVLYTQDADFSIEGKTLTWNTRRPADGKFYTVKYNAFLEWIVYATPLTRFDRDRKLGQRVLLRKVHVAYQNEHEFETAAKRQEQEVAFTTKTTI